MFYEMVMLSEELSSWFISREFYTKRIINTQFVDVILHFVLLEAS